MVVHSMGDCALALYIEPEEMPSLGLNMDEVDREAAQALVRSCFQERGMAPEYGALEIETYAGRAGIMLFAALHRPADHLVLRFMNLEALWDCANALSNGQCPQSRLYYAHDSYFLVLSGTTPQLQRIAVMAGEFGEIMPRAERLGWYLSEHGQVLAAEGALQKLKC